MTSLDDQLRELAGKLSPAELEHFRLIFCLAASGFGASGTESAAPRAFETVVGVLSGDRCPKPIYHGFPAFIDAERVGKLRAEAEERRSHAVRNARYALAYGGESGSRLASSPELAALLGSAVDGRRSTGARYLYYERDGDGVDPHIDNDNYAISAVLMLGHDSPGDPPSRLVLHHPGGESTQVALSPGEMLAFDAGKIVHSRETMRAGERVTLVTMGFL